MTNFSNILANLGRKLQYFGQKRRNPHKNNNFEPSDAISSVFTTTRGNIKVYESTAASMGSVYIYTTTIDTPKSMVKITNTIV